MKTTATRDQRFLCGNSRMIWLLVAALGACGLSASAQQPRERTLAERIQGRIKVSDEQGLVRAQLHRLPGTVLDQGSNDQPVGPYRVTTYRIEELSPPAALRAEVDGNTVFIQKAWRITITGGPFDLRAAPAMIWVDDEPVGIGVESPDLKSVSTIVYERSLLKAGAALALSYGSDPGDRNVLPERLRIARTR